MRLPHELVDWVREYTEAHHITMTQVVVDLLLLLKSENTA